MNGHTATLALYGGLALVLAYAAFGDLRARIIPNWLTLGIALSAPVMWWATGMTLWPGVAIQLAAAVTVLIIFAIFFAFNAMGGGDVKLIAALALWFPFAPFLQLLMIMSILGGVLTIIMLAREKLRNSDKKIEVPYGVAISLAGLWVIHERYLNHFG